MRKRSFNGDQAEAPLKNGERPLNVREEDGQVYLDRQHFEDKFEDDFESEEEFVEAEDELQDGFGQDQSVEEKMDTMQETFIPGRHKLAPGEVLEPDESTYEMLHTIELPWPCLSFDIIADHLGDGRARKTYPATVYMVAGTQAAHGCELENELLVMKMSKLSRMDNHEDETSDEDEDEGHLDPILETKSIPLASCTNRIRVHQRTRSDNPDSATIMSATMTESGDVFLHDLTNYASSLDKPEQPITAVQHEPIHIVKSHGGIEGYAIDWAPSSSQRSLLTGDSCGKVFLTVEHDGGSWSTRPSPFLGHQGSVEELQWSPSERNVFASASSDGTVKIWDSRSKSYTPALSMEISDCDVNVMSWSKLTSHLLASGSDDGQWAIWDLRQWKASHDGAPHPVASFNFHKEQITSIEWHPTDDSVVAVAAGDNTLTLWDLSVELDEEESRETVGIHDIPSQLLFVHYMEQVKECHWHPQIPGFLMATGNGGIGLLKTISI